VAVKVLRESELLAPADRERYEERFRREAEAAGGLHHPDIVRVYDVGPSWLVMEFIEGQPLSAFLRTARLTVGQTSELVGRVADAIDYAHRHGIVHRDVKPANIMITAGASVKPMDFGIAKLPDGTKTQAGLILGSPIYVAPEQVVGQSVDGRSDVFSLGVVLYEMLTGTVPFGGMAVGALLYSVINEAHPPPSAHNTSVPAVFERILARALAKHPDDRYQDAEEFARDLRGWRALPRPTPEELASLREPPRRTLDRRTGRRD
jgi:serine/threonine-protein kinase